MDASRTDIQVKVPCKIRILGLFCLDQDQFQWQKTKIFVDFNKNLTKRSSIGLILKGFDQFFRRFPNIF